MSKYFALAFFGCYALAIVAMSENARVVVDALKVLVTAVQ